MIRAEQAAQYRDRHGGVLGSDSQAQGARGFARRAGPRHPGPRGGPAPGVLLRVGTGGGTVRRGTGPARRVRSSDPRDDQYGHGSPSPGARQCGAGSGPVPAGAVQSLARSGRGGGRV
eukprot:668962-Hanusia_phi.AAC.1